jgi:hypothetical protein
MPPLAVGRCARKRRRTSCRHGLFRRAGTLTLLWEVLPQVHRGEAKLALFDAHDKSRNVAVPSSIPMQEGRFSVRPGTFVVGVLFCSPASESKFLITSSVQGIWSQSRLSRIGFVLHNSFPARPGRPRFRVPTARTSLRGARRRSNLNPGARPCSIQQFTLRAL